MTLLSYRKFKEMLNEGDARYLIPAVKHQGKIYKEPGWGHAGIITHHGLPFHAQKSVCGYINHRGHFLDRKKGMKYAKENDLLKHDAFANLLGVGTDFIELDTESLKPDAIRYPK